MNTDADKLAETILALEQAALERWNRGDVDGSLELYAEDVTFFDPITETRLDGREAVARYFRQFFEGKLNILRSDLPNPQVIVGGDMAVLTYNLANFSRGADGAEVAGTPWNSTQVYRRIEGKWRVVHVHWSFTRHPAAMQGLMA